MVDGVTDIQFPFKRLKFVAGSEPRYAHLNAENSLSVTFCFIVAYAFEIIKILVSFEHYFTLLLYDIYLNMHDFIYLEFVNWASVEIC